MKTLILLAALGLCMSAIGCTTVSVNVDHKTLKAGSIRHVVLFKFKDDATPAQIDKINAAFVALKSQIKEVAAFEWGTNISPEGLNQGLTHAYVATFNNAADRDAYLVHPAHKAFVELLKPSLDKATVIDFEPR